MKVPSLGVTQQFTDEVDWILDLTISVRLPTFYDDSHTNHIACSRYVKLQVFMGFRATIVCGVVHWNLSCFLRRLKNGSSLMLSCGMNLLKAAMHLFNFWTSWMLSGGFILVIADTFSGLGLTPRRETIYPSNLAEGTPKVHLSGFSFILNFLRLLKFFTTTSSTYVLAVIKCKYLPPTYLYFMQDIEDRCLLLMSSMSFIELPFQEHHMAGKNHMDQNPCISSICPK
jgi:hypothetical protein